MSLHREKFSYGGPHMTGFGPCCLDGIPLVFQRFSNDCIKTKTYVSGSGGIEQLPARADAGFRDAVIQGQGLTRCRRPSNQPGARGSHMARHSPMSTMASSIAVDSGSISKPRNGLSHVNKNSVRPSRGQPQTNNFVQSAPVFLSPYPRCCVDFLPPRPLMLFEPQSTGNAKDLWLVGNMPS